MIDGELLFLSAGEEFQGLEKVVLKEFKNDILEALNIDNEYNNLPFTYSPSDLTEFCNNVIEKRDEYASSRKFFSRFDSERLFNMIVQCTAKQIDDFSRRFVGNVPACTER